MLLLAMLVLPAACFVDRSSAPASAPPIVVHAILDAGTTDQLIVLEYARTGTDSAGTGIAGADVTIAGPDGTVMRAEEEAASADSTTRPRPGYYHLLLSRYGTAVIPGARYTLHVRTPDGGEVTGATTVPDAVPDTSVELQSFSPRHDTLRLQWADVPAARAYQISIDAPEHNLYQQFVTSVLVLPGSARTVTGDEIFLQTTSAPLQVVLIAVDTSYYEYYRQTSDPFAGAAPSRLTGAQGVFGSVVPIVARSLQIDLGNQGTSSHDGRTHARGSARSSVAIRIGLGACWGRWRELPIQGGIGLASCWRDWLNRRYGPGSSWRRTRASGSTHEG